MKRLTALLVTLLVAATATFVAPSSATTVEQQAKPKRPITMTYDQIGSSIKVTLKGKATDYKKKAIALQKKNGSRWVKVNGQKTQKNGNYSFTVWVPRDRKAHTFRVLTKKDSTYRKTASKPLGLQWT